MGNRHDVIPAGYWPYLGTGMRLLDEDLTALETGGIAGGSGGGSVAFDTAARKPDGVVQAGDRADSGHALAVRANRDDARFRWRDGHLVHDIIGSDHAAAYVGTELPGTVGRAWVDFEVTDGASEEAVIIVTGGDRPFTTPVTPTAGIVGSGFADSAAHLVIGPNGWSYGILTNDPWSIDEVANGAFQPPLEPGVTHTMRVDFDGDTVTVTTPRGIQVSATDPRIASPAYRGRFAAVELYAGAGAAQTPTRIVSWGAVQDAPLAARSFQPPQVPETTAVWLAPAAQLDIPVPSASAVITPAFSLPVTVPSTGKLLITATVHLDQDAPSIYLLGLNIGSGTGDGLQRVKTGAHSGTVTARWLWQLPVPGYTTTITPQHFIAGGGTGTVRFGLGNGYFGSLTAVPVA